MAVEPEATQGAVAMTTVTVGSEEGRSHGSHGDAALLCPQKILGRENVAWWQSSESVEWPTSQATFDALDAEFNFTLDPCATHENAKCARYFTKEDDGLAQSWAGERVFMNPPYGREIKHWVRKAFEAAELGATVVGLIPARPDTRYWHDYVAEAAEVRFVKRRLRFGDGRYPAPFPSAIVVWTPASVTDRCNCGRALQGRSDSRYCSNACRQKAYRQRRAS